MATEIPFLFMFASYAFWVLMPIFLATVIYNFIYGYRTPREAKKLRKAALSHKPINLTVGDDGYMDIEILEVSKSEGAASTNKNIDSPKRWLGFYSRKQKAPLDPELDKPENAKAFSMLNEIATTKTFLRGSKIPVWVSYRGKSVLASIQSLASMAITDELKVTLQNAQINIQTLKSLFGQNWNQIQVRDNEIEAFQEGQFVEKHRNKKGSEKMFMYLVLGVGFAFGMAAIMVVALYLTK
jgi:hypothetical protein